MKTILAWRATLQKLYSRYSVFVIHIARFILGFIVFQQIAENLGFMEAATSTTVSFGLALICAFFPLTVLVTVAAGVVLLQLYTLSLPVMVVTLIFLLLLYIMLLRFVPQRIWLVLVVVLAYIYNVPFVLPILFGLLGTTFFVVPLICGTIIYYILHYVATGYAAYVIEGLEMQGVIEIIVNFTQHSLENMEMWVMAAILVVCMLFVYAIRTRSFPHSWKVANGVGVIALAVSIVMVPPLVGLDLSDGLVEVILMSIIVGFVLEFLFFSVDYSKTEMLQFEDNEYYYYVKAIPKLGLVKADEKEYIDDEAAGPEKENAEGMLMREDEPKYKQNALKKRSKEESRDSRTIDSKGRDIRTIDSKGRDIRTIDSKDRDGRTIDGKGRDGRTIDSKGRDGRNIDSKDRDGRAMDSKERDGRAMDSKDRDGRAMDSKDRDGRAMDSKDRDGRTMDSKDRDGRTIDGKGRDSRFIDSKDRDGRTIDSKGRDGRAIDSKGRDSRSIDSNDRNGRTIDSKDIDGIFIGSKDRDGIFIDSKDRDGRTIDGIFIDSKDRDGRTIDSKDRDSRIIDSKSRDSRAINSKDVDSRDKDRARDKERDIDIDSIDKDSIDRYIRDGWESKPSDRKTGNGQYQQKLPPLDKEQEREYQQQRNSYQRKEALGAKPARPPGQRKGRPNPKQQKANQRQAPERWEVDEDAFITKNLTDELSVILLDEDEYIN